VATPIRFDNRSIRASISGLSHSGSASLPTQVRLGGCVVPRMKKNAKMPMKRHQRLPVRAIAINNACQESQCFSVLLTITQNRRKHQLAFFRLVFRQCFAANGFCLDEVRQKRLKQMKDPVQLRKRVRGNLIGHAKGKLILNVRNVVKIIRLIDMLSRSFDGILNRLLGEAIRAL